MSIVTMKEINKIYTNIVSDYISKGYWFYTNSMAGHQGEIAKVDLTNGENILRINMDTKYIDYAADCCIDTLRITVLEYKKSESRGVIWTSKGNIIKENCWYQVGRKNKAYTDNLNECISINNKVTERSKTKLSNFYNAYNFNKKFNNYNIDIIYDIVRKRKGYKSCSKKDILGVGRCKSGYYIEINGKAAVSISYPKYKI